MNVSLHVTHDYISMTHQKYQDKIVSHNIKPSTLDQVFLDNLSLERTIVQEQIMPAFEKVDLSRKNLPICIVHKNKLEL